MKQTGSKKRKVLIFLFVIILLPVLLMALAVQPFFIQAVILPRVEKATDSQISVGSLSFSPLSKLVIEDLAFRKNDESMKADVVSATLRYDVIKILRGTLTVGELTLRQPTVTYRIAEATEAQTTTSAPSTTGDKATTLFDIKNVSIQDGTFTYLQGSQALQLTNLTFALPSFVSGEPLQASFSTSVLSSTGTEPNNSTLEGTIKADVELGLTRELLPSSVKGQVAVRVESSVSGIPEQVSLDLMIDLEMDVAKNQFSVRELSALARQSDTDLFRLEVNQPTEIDLSGPVPTFTDTEITLDIPRVNLQDLPFADYFPTLSGSVYADSHLTITQSGKAAVAKMTVALENVLLENLKGETVIQATKLAGDISLNWKEGQPSTLLMNIDGNQIRLPGNKQVPSPLALYLDAEASPTEGTIRDFSLSWSETPDFDNHLQVKGFANWEDPTALEADLTVRASTLDLEPWSSFLVKSEEAIPQENSGPKEVSDPKIDVSSWPLKSIKADMEIDGIKLDKILLESIKVNLTAGPEYLRVQPASLVVNGSTFATDLDLSWEAGPLVFSTTSSLSPLDLEPIFDTLLPTKPGAITGVLQGQTSFDTQGQTLSELWGALNGSIDMAYTKGKLRLIDPDPEQNTGLFHTRKLVQDLITALAKSLKLSPDQLMAPDIEAVLFQARLEDQHLSLNKAKILNPEFMMEASGSLRLSTQIEQSRIENLPVVMGVHTNLAKRVKIYRENRVQDSYVVLPSFIGATGTLEEPKIDVKESVITGLVISGVRERNDFGNENVQTALDVLGSVLTGEPIPSKPTPAPESAPPGSTPTPTPEPSKADQVLEGLRFLQQLRATPTPIP